MCNVKKILFIESNRDGTIGGSYYSLLYLVQGLDKNRYEPHVLFCQYNVLISEFRKVTPYVYIDNFGPSCSDPASSVSDYLKWPYRIIKQVIFKQIKLKKIIKKIKPDLVHLNNGYSGMHEWMLACYLNDIKVIAHDRGTRSPCSLRTRFFIRFLDAIISVSDSYKNNVLRQALKVKRLIRIYNGLDIEQVIGKISQAGIDTIKDEFNLNNSSAVVGIIGNIDRWKGQLVVLKAIKEIKLRYPDIKCLFVGKVVMRAEQYKEELDRYIVDNDLDNNIIFTGPRDDVPNILSVLDVVIHGSIEPEPFGRVLLEGMAAGKPIVASNAGGPIEIIVDGETGLLVPMNDPQRMAEAITELLSDRKRALEMGRKGRQRLIEMFSIKDMIENIERTYDDLFQYDKSC